MFGDSPKKEVAPLVELKLTENTVAIDKDILNLEEAKSRKKRARMIESSDED